MTATGARVLNLNVPTNHVGHDAGAAEQWSHLLFVDALGALLPTARVDVHQEALGSVACEEH